MFEALRTRERSPATTPSSVPPPRPDVRVERIAETHEQRKNPRYAVELEVGLGSDHNFYHGLSENMSEGGIFIATHRTYSKGDHIELTIGLPTEPDPVAVTGEIRWVREYSETSDVPPGIGVAFTDLSEAAEEAIRRFLQARAPLFYEE